MATSADQYHNKLQQELADRASASGHSLSGPGNQQDSLGGASYGNGIGNDQSGLSREPSYVDRSSGAYPQEKSGLPLAELGNGSMHKVRTLEGEPQSSYNNNNNNNNSNDVNGIQRHLHDTDLNRQSYLPQGEQEYPGRDNALVVDHDRYNQIVGRQDTPRESYQPQQEQPMQQSQHNSVQPGEVYPYEQQQQQQQQPQELYQDQEQGRPDMQPSRSYLGNRPASEYAPVQQQPQLQTFQEIPRQEQQQQPTSNGFAGVGSGAPIQSNDYPTQHQQSLQHGQQLSSFPASGAIAQQQYQEPQYQQQQPQQAFIQTQPLHNIDTSGDLQRKSTIGTTHTGAIAVGNQSLTNGDNRQSTYQPQQQQQQQQALSPTPTSPTAAQNMNGQPDIRALSSGTSAAASPIAGGGLGAAIASSGHSLKSSDKKALKNEIKTEKAFEKSLGSQAKSEARSIDDAIKMAKLSSKAAEKSGKHELGYRKTYDRAVKDEVKMKERLLKITSEYNKVAAELEKATKEMEIRKNSHKADLETRDADARKVDELRKAKGVHDMEREALHGESLTKQHQAKRALSMSGKRKSTAF